VPQSDIFNPQRAVIDQPSCPNCGSPMWLVRIEPYKPHHDLRSFECTECDLSETKVVKFK
jgi:transposase-like protein